jgi:hypothetical protein
LINFLKFLVFLTIKIVKVLFLSLIQYKAKFAKKSIILYKYL